MIFPILNGVQSLLKAPITWLIFFLNLAVFVGTFNESERSQIALEDYIRDSAFSETQGLVFARYIEEHASRYPASLQVLAQKSLSSSENDRRQILGSMALRDNTFLANVSNLTDGPGDPVAFQWWQHKVKDLKEVRDAHPSYALGLTNENSDFVHWITYQFSHSGVAHFVGNMVFFLIFASSLELVVGSLGLLVIYLMSGIAAALMFLATSDASAIPLIGASGAISGIVAFFCALMWQRGVRYAYVLFIPRRGFAGIIYLPAWVTLGVWVLSDIAGQWATPPELGGIAYSAHLGGELCGVLAALILFGIRKFRGQPMLPNELPFETKPVLTYYA